MSDNLGQPGVLLYGLTNAGAAVPVKVDGTGLLAGGGNPFDQDLNIADSPEFAGLTVANLIYPAVDGAADEVLATDGAGNLSFVPTTAFGVVQKVVVDLTSAQLKTLFSSPVEIVPAPSATQWIQVVMASVQYKFGTIRYGTTGVQDFLFKYLGVANQPVPGFNSEEVFQGQTVSRLTFSPGANTSINQTNAVQRAITVSEGTYDAGTVGSINASVINAPGLGYAANDTFTVDTGDGLAAGIVDTVGALGIVTSYHLTSNGQNYVVGVGVATTATSGVGIGFTLDIQSITPGNGTMRVIVVYVVNEIL